MIGYGVGNAAGPQYWKAKYQPRNRVPWTILAVCWFVSGVLLLVTRWYLARENARREREPRDVRYDEVYITELREDGTKVEAKVDKVRFRLISGGLAGFCGWRLMKPDRPSWTLRTARTAISAMCCNAPGLGLCLCCYDLLALTIVHYLLSLDATRPLSLHVFVSYSSILLNGWMDAFDIIFLTSVSHHQATINHSGATRAGAAQKLADTWKLTK